MNPVLPIVSANQTTYVLTPIVDSVPIQLVKHVKVFPIREFTGVATSIAPITMSVKKGWSVITTLVAILTT